jgi:radical SAM superfamily enzyme YgiQ (UPF0313 family)
MKVALVFPRARYPSGDPPLGVAYLAAMLRERTGEAPAIIDTTFAADPAAFLKQELGKDRYDLVGISAMVTMAREAVLAARIAKESNPKALVIMGGPHATTLPEEVLREEAVDAVCVGEGEQAFVKVAEQGGVHGVPGMMVRDGQGGMTGEPPELIPDLDALPFPAFDLLPMDDYFRHWFQLDGVAPGLKGTNILATRGCPFKCSYCQPTLDKLFGKGVRKRSPKNVVDELVYLQDRFGVSGYLFADDTFIADRKWVESFCSELKNRDAGLIWGCNVRADLVTPELLETMREAGLGKIYIGIEVYDDECRREVFNKKLTREHVEATVDAARSLGVQTQGYFMLGAPGESKKDVWNTVRYAWRLPLDDATFNITTPLPGTYLYEKHRDRITGRHEDMDYYKRYAFRPEGGVSERWLNRMQLTAYTGFYGSPHRLRRQVGSLFAPGGVKRFLAKSRRVF